MDVSTPRKIRCYPNFVIFNDANTSDKCLKSFKQNNDLMQESTILPCDRDFQLSKSLQYHDKKDTDSLLNSSYLETESNVSSCMLTSYGYYTHSEGTSETMCKVNEFANSGPIYLDPPPVCNFESHTKKSQVFNENFQEPDNSRQINGFYAQEYLDNFSESLWSGRMETLAFIPTSVEKDHCFKICFDTEYSDNEENIRIDRIARCFDSTRDDISKKLSLGDSITENQSEHLYGELSGRNSIIEMLHPRTRDLVSPIRNANGFFCQGDLTALSIPQLQIILNDLLTQISHLNEILMELLPLRDELRYENEDSQLEHDNFISSLRLSAARAQHRSPICHKHGSNQVPDINFSSALFAPVRITFETKNSSNKHVSKLKSYIYGLFSARKT